MKHIFTLFGALALACALQAQNVATFENATGSINIVKADTVWQGADTPVDGWNNWQSGDYRFQTYFKQSYFMYNAFTVSNETATTSTGSDQSYRSASGGAYEGDNFAVWNLPYYGIDSITFAKQTIQGFFVNNNAYPVNSMLNGDSYARKFGKDDYFLLYCIGYLNGNVTDTVEFYLAKDGEYVADWTYIDLSSLGEIDAMTFDMASSDNNYGYMNTPAYFCMDNFGAAKPTNYVEPARKQFPVNPTDVAETEINNKVQKTLYNGQIVIIRNGMMFNIQGVVVK